MAEIVIDIDALPVSSGRTPSAILYQIDATAPAALPGGWSVGSRTLTVSSGAATAQVRIAAAPLSARVAPVWSAAATVILPELLAPAAFLSDDWAVVDAAASGGDVATLALSALPAGEVSGIEYELDMSGAWRAVGSVRPGEQQIDGFTPGVAHTVRLRAVNAAGPGAPSDAKPVVTSAPPVARVTLAGPTDEAARRGVTSGAGNRHAHFAGFITAAAPGDYLVAISVSTWGNLTVSRPQIGPSGFAYGAGASLTPLGQFGFTGTRQIFVGRVTLPAAGVYDLRVDSGNNSYALNAPAADAFLLENVGELLASAKGEGADASPATVTGIPDSAILIGVFGNTGVTAPGADPVWPGDFAGAETRSTRLLATSGSRLSVASAFKVGMGAASAQADGPNASDFNVIFALKNLAFAGAPAAPATAPDPIVGPNLITGAPTGAVGAVTAVAGGHRITRTSTAPGFGDIRGWWTFAGVTPLEQHRLRMTVDTAGVPVGRRIDVRVTHVADLADEGGFPSDLGRAALVIPIISDGAEQTVEGWFRPRAATFYVGAARYHPDSNYEPDFFSPAGQQKFIAPDLGEYFEIRNVDLVRVQEQLAPGQSGVFDHVEDRGVRFQFAAPHTVGRYVTGEYWVLNDDPSNPVTVQSIYPPSAKVEDRVRHGAMLNWGSNVSGAVVEANGAGYGPEYQGFDGRGAGGTSKPYLSSENVDPGQTGAAITFSATGSGVEATLSKAVSMQDERMTGKWAMVADIAHLTVVAQRPAADAFRPAPAAASKASPAREADMDWSVFPALASPAGVTAPSALSAIRNFAYSWDVGSSKGNAGRNIRAFNHDIDYGGDRARHLGRAALLLCTDVSQADKRPIALGLVQLGLDIAGRIALGGIFPAAGGSDPGIKVPLVIAARALNRVAGTFDFGGGMTLAAAADGTANPRFADDREVALVTGPELMKVHKTGSSNGGRPGDPYFPWHEGMVEWGIARPGSPNTGSSSWGASYRGIANGERFGALVAMQLIAGARAAWNRDLTWQWWRRYIHYEYEFSGSRVDVGHGWDAWARAMLDAHVQPRTGAPIASHTHGLEYFNQRLLPVDMVIGRPFLLDLRSFEFPFGGAPTSYALTAGALPAGLTLDPASGVISGTPAGPAGFHAATFTARNAAGSSSPTTLRFMAQRDAGVGALVDIQATMPEHIADGANLWSFASNSLVSRLTVNGAAPSRSFTVSRAGAASPQENVGSNPSIAWRLEGLEPGATYRVTATAQRGTIPAAATLAAVASPLHFLPASPTLASAAAPAGADLAADFIFVATRAMAWVGVRADVTTGEPGFTLTGLTVQRR